MRCPKDATRDRPNSDKKGDFHLWEKTKTNKTDHKGENGTGQVAVKAVARKGKSDVWGSEI